MRGRAQLHTAPVGHTLSSQYSTWVWLFLYSQYFLRAEVFRQVPHTLNRHQSSLCYHLPTCQPRGPHLCVVVCVWRGKYMSLISLGSLLGSLMLWQAHGPLSIYCPASVKGPNTWGYDLVLDSTCSGAREGGQGRLPGPRWRSNGF